MFKISVPPARGSKTDESLTSTTRESWRMQLAYMTKTLEMDLHPCKSAEIYAIFTN